MKARTQVPIQAGLKCPKCAGPMRSYERSGIIVEQCEDCRGIFLDRGELERLIDLEGGGWSGRVGPPQESLSPTSDRRGLRRERVGATADDRQSRENRVESLMELFGDD